MAGRSTMGATLQPVIVTDGKAIVLSLDARESELGRAAADLDVATMSRRIEQRLLAAGTGFAYGRWGERRGIYTSALFAEEGASARRDVHLGIDVFCAPGTPVVAPLAAEVHAVNNNAAELDYGPVVILQHEGEDAPFFTLYGHLGFDCLDRLEAGQTVAAGEAFATVGSPPGNGNWPPHLHFQLIHDLLGLGTDFPGVVRADETDRWFALSPLPAEFFPDVDAVELDGRR